MDASQMRHELEAIREAPDFNFESAALVDSWEAARLGSEAVEPVLRFMEFHPEIDYGMPGALVHFVECFHRRGYEQLLLASVARRPTPHTAWMLNRLIKGTQDPALRREYTQAMERALVHPQTDEPTRGEIRGYLKSCR